MPGLGPIELLIIVVFVLVIGLVVVGVVTTAVAVARRDRRGRLDPATPHAGPSGQAAPAAPQTLEQRLRELDDLRARGVITEQEHAAARSRALGG